MIARWLGAVKTPTEARAMAQAHGLTTVVGLHWEIEGEGAIEVYTWPLSKTEYPIPLEVRAWAFPERYMGLRIYAAKLS